MPGSLNILEGNGKGTSKPLTDSLMVVGRSKNADFQVDDPMVSRRHLEIRVEADGVFIENLSTHGSRLNGTALAGVVSLNPGDVIEIGNTKMRFDDGPAASATMNSIGAGEAEIDGTRIADPGLQPNRRKEQAPDATHALVDDGTRMLNAAELPNWVAQEKIVQKASSKGRTGMVFILILLLAVAGGAYWFTSVRGATHHAPGGVIDYKDSLYRFSLEYPLEWEKISDDTGLIVFGFGAEGNGDWGRLKIFTDRGANHEITGLTDGFVEYEDVLKKRYPDFSLLGRKRMEVHQATVIFFAFTAKAMQGKGIYLLNGDTRIVAECVSANSCYQRYASTYSSVLQSFNLGSAEIQQFIDFPLPDSGMQQLALANPAELTRQINEHNRRAEMLLNSQGVKPDNLFAAVKEYQIASQLAIAGPQRQAGYSAAAQGLAQATRLFNQSLRHQRFEVSSAVREGDLERAYWAANKMMQMVPDKTDPAYQEASKVVRSLPPPK
jgi:hypothetical protein